MRILICFLVTLMIIPSMGFSEKENIYKPFAEDAERAVDALSESLLKEQQQLYIYKDFADTENNYTQKAKIFGINGENVRDLNENWRDNPHSGFSCIRCEQMVMNGDWGGWLFMNGMLSEDGITAVLNDGKTDEQGLNLSGAQELRFFARGENGGEKVEFFTCGFGDGDPTVQYRDSEHKRTLGVVKLTKDWKEYVIDLRGERMDYIALGFGFVMSGSQGTGEKVFYLDDIRFTGKPFVSEGGYFMLRSYVTDNQYIFNAAFTYDNALAAMAFLSAGRQEEAAKILDSFVFAVENDRWKPGRIRNAYVAGNLISFTGWAEGQKARLPGWYDLEASSWYEDQYQTGSNVGNTSYAALALLQYDHIYGNEKYAQTAATLMNWVLEECRLSEGPGFTAGYDGWPENGPETTYFWTYKSIEHNIDAYAAFLRLYEKTGELKYQRGAESALALIRSLYDGDKKLFYTGTGNDGVTISKDNIVLDAQVWSCLSLGDQFAPYTDVLETVSAMKTKEGGYPFCLSNENGGWWSEGTAFTALMYRTLGLEDEAVSALSALKSVQLDNGYFPAASTDHLSTGFYLFTGAPWEYGTAEHISPTAWFVMAVNGFNPYSFAR